MSTLVANNFIGELTRNRIGTLDSGKAIYDFTHSHNNYDFPGAIQFMEKPIDITGNITDAIIDGATRAENGILYVYMIGHTGKLWKMQVNDPATYNPSLFNSVLVAQLTTATSFHQGGSLKFFGASEKILIGHDDGVTVIDLDGTNERLIEGNWNTGVPRQAVILGGFIYYTNGNQITSIGPDFTVVQLSLLSPLAADQVYKDIEIDGTGQNILAISANVPNSDMTIFDEDTLSGYAAVSYVYRIDPIQKKFISTNPTPSFNQTALLTVGDREYVFGYDVAGGGLTEITKDFQKQVSGVGALVLSKSPSPNAVGASGNVIGWVTPEANVPYHIFGGIGTPTNASVFFSGPLDLDSPDPAYYREAHLGSSLPGGDIIKVPCEITITNQIQNGSTSAYPISTIWPTPTLARLIYSTVEYNQAGYAYKLYAFKAATSLMVPMAQGVYQTQLLLANTDTTHTTSTFTPSVVRIYCHPLFGYETFMVSLTGITGDPIDGDSHIFTGTGFPGNAAMGAIKLNAEPTEGTTVTIGGGGPTVTFEFDSNGSVSGSNIPVTLQGSAAATAAELATVISANLLITATPNATGVVFLTNQTVGVAGNVIMSSSDPFNILINGMFMGLDPIPAPNITVGQEILTFTPTGGATFALGVRVTNLGPYMTPFIFKIEIDY